jgi:hypothetical protein
MINTSLKLEINSLPKELRAELADFIEFLKKNPGQNLNSSHANLVLLRVKLNFLKTLTSHLTNLKTTLNGFQPETYNFEPGT